MSDNQLIIIGTAVIAGVVIMYLLNSCESDPLPLSVRTPSRSGGGGKGNVFDTVWRDDGTISVTHGSHSVTIPIQEYVATPARELTVVVSPQTHPISESNGVYLFQVSVSTDEGHSLPRVLRLGRYGPLWDAVHDIHNNEVRVENASPVWSVTTADDKQSTSVLTGDPSRMAIDFKINGKAKIMIIEKDASNNEWCYISLDPAWEV